jgi:hypothetical protein
MAGAAFAKGLEVWRMAYLQGGYDMPVFGEVMTETGVEERQIDTKWIECRDQHDALELGLEALMLAYDDSVETFGSAKTLDRMCGALEFYADRYPLDDPEHGTVAIIGGKPAVEWNFALPLPVLHPDTGEPLIFCGRLDVVLDIFSGRYLTDDKTTSSLGASWPNQWEMRGQFVGYAWAARELGLQVDGTLVRGVSILKTKYETAQKPVHQPGWKIDEWLSAVTHKLEYAKVLYAQHANVAAFGEPCNEYGGCEFRDICQARDHAGWLESNFVERNWNPLERH